MNKPLMEAAASGDLVAARRIIMDGAGVNGDDREVNYEALNACYRLCCAPLINFMLPLIF